MKSLSSPPLPVDLAQKSEMVQNRIGTIIVFSVLMVLVVLLLLLSASVGSAISRGASSLPDIRLLKDWRPTQTTLIYDKNGDLIANIHGDEDRVVVPYNQISPHVMQAVMAIEDNRFYHHDGVDVRGTIRAAAANLLGKEVQGGSTVTQQLVKNLFLTPERSISRKLAEAMLSVQVEHQYSKEQIMEMYLNQVYFGNLAYGIEKAAKRYFNISAKDLSVGQSALLAGLLKAPEGLSPYHSPEKARARQLLVLHNMVKHGFITEEQAETAKKQDWDLKPRIAHHAKYSYFITYVIQELMDQFGEDVVRRGGLKVYTTLDPQVQEAAEKLIEDAVKKAPRGSNIDQGAVVAIDVKGGKIVSLVGGVDFVHNQFNNATQARRAAGSTFKPIVYLTGFRLGVITPESPISDRPVSFNTGVSIWTPKNWDGKFMGAMNVRRALTLSRNTPTVQVGMKVGIDAVIETAQKAGITSKIDANFSSLLGSSGISPYEMATVYSTFAREGVRVYPTPIQRLEDVKGRVIPFDRPKPEQSFDPNDVANLNSILVDVVEKGTGTGARIKGRQVAGKTGTTDKVRDIWFSGYTPDLTAVVWFGNSKYVPLRYVFSSYAANAWREFAEAYYQHNPIPATTFTPPVKAGKKGTDGLKTFPTQFVGGSGGSGESRPSQKRPGEGERDNPVPPRSGRIDPEPSEPQGPPPPVIGPQPSPSGGGATPSPATPSGGSAPATPASTPPAPKAPPVPVAPAATEN